MTADRVRLKMAGRTKKETSMHILGYHVFTTRDGGLWLDYSEHKWTDRFTEAASFTSYELAKDIGDREATDDDTIYIFACM